MCVGGGGVLDCRLADKETCFAGLILVACLSSRLMCTQLHPRIDVALMSVGEERVKFQLYDDLSF